MSDSDSSLDSELLKVAGGRRGKGAGKKRKAVSESEEEDESSEDVSLDDESDWEEARTTSANKKKKGGSAAKPARKRQARRRAASSSEEEGEDDDDDDDDEEFGAPPGARRQRGGGSSDDDDDRLEIDEEELIEDEEDRKRLAAMTELQREYELANRAEKRNQELQRQKLLKMTDAKAERAGAKAAKRVGRVKSGREEREEAAKKSAMEELKAARERKARGAEERARKRGSSEELEDEDGQGAAAGRRRHERERSPSEDGALESEDDMSDGERRQMGGMYGRQHYRREYEDEEEDEAPVDDVKKIHVRREKLEQWVNEPFFEDTLPGCMVRIVQPGAHGPDGQAHRRYALCQVVAVETRAPGVYKDSGIAWKSPYPLGPGGEKTHKWLLVERGGSQRGMPLAQVSNSGFSEAEFESWQRALKESGRPQVSRRVAKDAHERLVKANTYTYTAADVDRVLKEKKAKGQAPFNAALEKARLERELDHAREHGEADKAAELAAQLEALVDQLAQASSKQRRTVGMADLNRRNADMNFKNALDNVSNKVGVSGAAQDDKDASQLDPFSRRATRPIIYWSTKRQTGEEEPDAEAAAAAEASGEAAKAEAEAAAQKQRLKRPDLDAIVDLSNLDLAPLELPARMPPLARKLLGATWRPAPLPPNTRIISLEDYKRAKGWA